MAISEVSSEFKQTNLLSKVQVDGVTYYLKDAEVRTILGKLTAAAFTELSNGDVDANDNGLVTGAQVANAIKELNGAMHFVDVNAEGYTPTAGDVKIDGTKEYVYDGSKWVELGDEGLHVAKTTKIAGIDLQDDITVDELAAALSDELKSVLELGKLAYVDSASGATTLDTIDTITMAAVTVAGNAAVTTSDATVESEGEYTPEGQITISGNVVSNATFGASEEADAVQITGTISSPDITVTPEAKTITHEVVDDKGSIATWTGASYTAPTLGDASSSAFAEDGVLAAIDETDKEMLVFSTASKSNALTAQGSFNAGSVDFGTFDGGSMPTYKTFTESVLGSVTASLASAPQFTGGKYKVSTSSAANGLTAEFTGTKATLSVEGTYQKANANAAYSVEVTPTVAAYNRTAKDIDITVNPDEKTSA